MYYSYWNMTLSSIEKRLQIPSQTTGIITAINDVSHILVSATINDCLTNKAAAYIFASYRWCWSSRISAGKVTGLVGKSKTVLPANSAA